MSDDACDLDALLTLSYGLYVVSSAADGRSNAQISNAVMQVTDSPPRLAAAVNKESLTHELIAASGVFAVTVLAETAPMKFIGVLGFRSGRDIDKLSRVADETGVTGCPIVSEHAIACAEVRVDHSLDCKTHTIFVGEVVAAQIMDEGRPMTYAYYREVLGGKTPPTAPTYRAPSAAPPPAPQKKESSSMQKYICDICQWVYNPTVGDPGNGVEPGTAFADLPDDWVCPECGAGKEDFSPFE